MPEVNTSAKHLSLTITPILRLTGLEQVSIRQNRSKEGCT